MNCSSATQIPKYLYTSEEVLKGKISLYFWLLGLHMWQNKSYSEWTNENEAKNLELEGTNSWKFSFLIYESCWRIVRRLPHRVLSFIPHSFMLCEKNVESLWALLQEALGIRGNSGIGLMKSSIVYFLLILRTLLEMHKSSMLSWNTMLQPHKPLVPLLWEEEKFEQEQVTMLTFCNRWEWTADGLATWNQKITTLERICRWERDWTR